MQSLVVATKYAVLVLALMACKDKNSSSPNTHSVPASVGIDDLRYYAFQLKAYRDQHRLTKERVLVNKKMARFTPERCG